jgi:hypothetical protein
MEEHMDRDDLIHSIKQDFFYNTTTVFRKDQKRSLKDNTRSDEEQEAFETWLDRQCFDDEELTWFNEYPADIEERFNQDPRAQLHKIELILYAMNKDIEDINAKLRRCQGSI